MKDINILEEKIKIIESLCTDDCINKETVIKPLKYAISNIISENKELKENSIPKSKVEAKIEEVSNGTYDAKIVLQSLLEKE